MRNHCSLVKCINKDKKIEGFFTICLYYIKNTMTRFISHRNNKIELLTEAKTISVMELEKLKTMYISHRRSDTVNISVIDEGGYFRGCYFISDKGGYTYYFFENIAFGSIVRRKTPLNMNVYLANIHKIHFGTYEYEKKDLDPTELVLTHYIDEFDTFKKNGMYYFANDDQLKIMD